MKSSRPADLGSMGKSNESIRLLDWRNCEQFFLIRVDWFDSSIRTVFYVLQHILLQHIKGHSMVSVSVGTFTPSFSKPTVLSSGTVPPLTR